MKCMKYENMKYIIGIDVSSTNIKIGLISDNGEVIAQTIIAHDIKKDGEFGLCFDLDEIWDKITDGIKEVLSKIENKKDVIAISSCAQRIATVFLDKDLKAFYGGPNKDARGLDAQWLIDDEYEDEEGERRLFNITAHNPPLVFSLARLLWYKEEEEEQFKKMGKVLMLDDWIQFKLSGELVSDPAVASESQFLDIKEKKWSEEIIETFELDHSWFPTLIEPGTITGKIISDLANEFQLPTDTKIVKSGPDTQTGLVGMGCIEDKEVGIPLGTTAPIMMVINEPKIDDTRTFWTSCNLIPNTWVMEANGGMTGMVFDWYKDNIIQDLEDNPYSIIESYLEKTDPGANSSFAFMGPELMNFKNQTDIKRSVLVFPSHSSISDIESNKATMLRSIIENIGFAVLENFTGLKERAGDGGVQKVYCAGGMANSKHILQIISDILGIELYVPKLRESGWLGFLINCMVALDEYDSYRSAVDSLVQLDVFSPNIENTKRYKRIYTQWKRYKEKLDEL
ncbi:MAG: hypothetical protein GF364_00365 [Candidatus Lokiarchaeota archaeon]|nr:hypothetical protein [Candidatus Lokiarchaeota archaeon]